MKRIFWFAHAVFASALLLASCASIQDDTLASTDNGEYDAELASIEARLVSLDSETLKGNDITSWNETVKATRANINALGKNGVRDSAFEATLAAFSGRLALLEGKPSEAARMLKKASELSGDEVAVVLLRARVEADPEKRLALLAESLALSPDGDALRVEQARAYLELRRYREAVASFDSAFARLGAAYSDAYGDERERAWRLRDVSADAAQDTALIAVKDRILWRDAVLYASRETGLLDFFTGGKDVPPDELFKRLVAKGVVRAAAPDAAVTRSELSWFLWRLVAELRAEPVLLDKYSRRYSSASGASGASGVSVASAPISDVPVDSFFFDSAMGCVEWEIMSLPDGRLFRPDESVSGAAYVQMLKKIR